MTDKSSGGPGDPGGQAGDNNEDKTENQNKDKTLVDPLLGVVNWWCLRLGKEEVTSLVVRHFDHTEVYNSCVTLAQTCGLDKPINHKNTAGRQAIGPCATDLVKIMKDLTNSKQVPNILIPATDLGKVPLDALASNAERSVSARLESLESSLNSVVSAVEKLTALRNPTPVQVPALSIDPAPVPTALMPGSLPASQTFADVAARLLQPSTQGGAGNQVRQGRLGSSVADNRVRSRSPQVKRGHDSEVDSEGFRRPGRPRHQNRQAEAGASKVLVEDVGELQASLQYYIGNTPGRANEEVIKKVLERCAVPLLEEGRGPLVIESVHCLTKDPEPRTKCWRVVVPPSFKDIMENSQLYPEGWRFREFVGVFRNSNKSVKKFRIQDSSIVDQVMSETGQSGQQGNDQLLLSLQQQVAQLIRQQGGAQAVGASAEPAQPAQG